MTDVVSHQTDGIPEAIYVDGEEQRKYSLFRISFASTKKNKPRLFWALHVP